MKWDLLGVELIVVSKVDCYKGQRPFTGPVETLLRTYSLNKSNFVIFSGCNGASCLGHLFSSGLFQPLPWVSATKAFEMSLFWSSFIVRNRLNWVNEHLIGVDFSKMINFIFWLIASVGALWLLFSWVVGYRFYKYPQVLTITIKFCVEPH